MSARFFRIAWRGVWSPPFHKLYTHSCLGRVVVMKITLEAVNQLQSTPRAWLGLLSLVLVLSARFRGMGYELSPRGWRWRHLVLMWSLGLLAVAVVDKERQQARVCRLLDPPAVLRTRHCRSGEDKQLAATAAQMRQASNVACAV